LKQLQGPIDVAERTEWGGWVKVYDDVGTTKVRFHRFDAVAYCRQFRGIIAGQHRRPFDDVVDAEVTSSLQNLRIITAQPNCREVTAISSLLNRVCKERFAGNHPNVLARNTL
jgi:hypothetical protein